MTIKDLINLMEHHIKDKIIDLSSPGSLSHMTEEQKIAAFWCGRQTATWAIDLIESSNRDGIIDSDEMEKHMQTVMELNRILQRNRP